MLQTLRDLPLQSIMTQSGLRLRCMTLFWLTFSMISPIYFTVSLANSIWLASLLGSSSMASRRVFEPFDRSKSEMLSSSSKTSINFTTPAKFCRRSSDLSSYLKTWMFSWWDLLKVLSSYCTNLQFLIATIFLEQTRASGNFFNTIY